MSKVITREKGVVPGCVPAGSNKGELVIKPVSVTAFLNEMADAINQARKARGAEALKFDWCPKHNRS